jgi:hypothetical protein
MKLKLLVATVVLLVVLLAGLKYLQPDAVAPAIQPTPPKTARTFNPRVPTPHASAVSEAAPDISAEDSNLQALLTRLFGTNGLPELKPEQLETYLKDNHRNAASLLAAWRATSDRALLREAMEKYPNDPRVAFEAYFRSEPYDSSKPATEERRKWLDTLRQSDPGNALADYLSACDHFRSGRTELALQELQAASGKSAFRDYTIDFVQDSEEAYRSAGYAEGPAKWVSTFSQPLPTLTELKQVGLNISDLAKQYRQAGDPASAQAVLQLGLNLRDRFNGSDQFPMINTLVGIVIEKNLLSAMDPSAPYGNSGRTVQNQLDALTQQRADFKVLVKQTDALLPTIPDPDLVAYFNRLRTFGEAAAMRWVVDKYGRDL